MTFHSQLFMESHLKFIKIHGFPNISKPPTSLECSRILARPSRLGYIRDHLTTEWPNKNSRRLSHPSVPCPCWSRSRTRPWNMLGILYIYIYLYISLLQCPGTHSLRVSENRRYFLRYPPGIKRGSKLPFLSISIHFYLWIIDRDNNSNIIYYILFILSINYL